MTRLNWEKANARERYFRNVFWDHGATGAESHFTDEFDINNPTQNPLGLSDDDCRGRMPSAAKRVAIFRYLVQQDRSLRDRYAAELALMGDDFQISSKDFSEFSRRVFLSSLAWPGNRCPLEIIMPVAVCFSIICLSAYNMRVSAHEKVRILTPEVFRKLQEMPPMKSSF